MGDLLYLRQAIDTNCPIIFEGNWESVHADGWRWALNLYYEDKEDSRATLDEYLTAHGPLNVTLGWAFNEDKLRPSVMPGFCGLYVRDVDDLVRELNRDLNNLNVVEKWLET